MAVMAEHISNTVIRESVTFFVIPFVFFASTVTGIKLSLRNNVRLCNRPGYTTRWGPGIMKEMLVTSVVVCTVLLIVGQIIGHPAWFWSAASLPVVVFPLMTVYTFKYGK